MARVQCNYPTFSHELSGISNYQETKTIPYFNSQLGLQRTFSIVYIK